VSRENEIRNRLKTPRAAAVAGIVFSILLITSQLLVWISIPANVGEAALEVVSQSRRITLALNLLPFAGIAFLWFIGVVRDRLGRLEDRFFATVFLGSGLLYIAMTGAIAPADHCCFLDSQLVEDSHVAPGRGRGCR